MSNCIKFYRTELISISALGPGNQLIYWRAIKTMPKGQKFLSGSVPGRNLKRSEKQTGTYLAVGQISPYDLHE